MTPKQRSIIFIAFLTLVIMLLADRHSTIAQVGQFSHIVPIDAGQGSIRFFDTTTGHLYTYDRTLQEITRVVQLKELGKPASVIHDSAQNSDNRYQNPRENK